MCSEHSTKMFELGENNIYIDLKCRNFPGQIKSILNTVLEKSDTLLGRFATAVCFFKLWTMALSFVCCHPNS